jgi:hypothetical protein
MAGRALKAVFVLAFGVAVVLAYADAAEAQKYVTDGLVSYWNFDEVKGGTVRDLVSGNDGTLVENVVSVAGKFGKGLEFDGESRVEVPDPAAFDFNADFTWSAWIETEEDGTIVAETRGEDDQGPKTFFIRNGTLFFDIGWCCGAGGSEQVIDGVWHYVVVTVEFAAGDDTLKYYVDGEFDAEVNLNVDSFPEAEFPLWIGFDGRADPGEFPAFIGIIDEVSVYERALSADEVQQNFSAGAFKAAVEPAEKLATTWGSAKALE